MNKPILHIYETIVASDLACREFIESGVAILDVSWNQRVVRLMNGNDYWFIPKSQLPNILYGIELFGWESECSLEPHIIDLLNSRIR